MATNSNKPFDSFAVQKKQLDETLKIEKQNSQELAKWLGQLDDKRLASEEKARKRMNEEVNRQALELSLKGVEVTVALKAQLEKEYIKKLEADEKKKRIEKQRQEARESTRKGKEEKRKQDKENRILDLLSKYDSEGNLKSQEQMKKDTREAGWLQLKDSLEKGLEKLGESFSNSVNKAMAQYANYQTGINARLQSTGKNFASIEKNLGKVAYSPLLKADTLYANLSKLVQDGIVSNVEQRAFLMTIKDNIATTFDANNNAIRRIIRVQQQDSTASRLGLEAFLTRYMNSLVQNTEYLTTTFDNVQEALLEASSLMDMGGSTAFEFQVQKWLGAMTGLGLSESTSSSLAQALGYLGSGNIESLNSSALQNLLVMASSRAGISYGELLKGGLSAETTNELLSSVVDFVQDIWENTKDNNVTLSQLSNTFGLTVSDVRSIANMSESIKNSLVSTSMDTDEMYSELGYQFKQMGSRMSIATLMSNAFSNFSFQTGATMASNPATYALWKIADFITSTTGGINIPHATVLGTGVDLNATVEQLLKLGLVGYSTLSNITGIASAVKSIGNGAALLNAMGISEGNTLISRGANLSTTVSGFTTSQSSYMMNQNEGAYQQGANMMMREQQDVATQENTNKPTVDLETINTNMVEKLDVIIDYLGNTGIKIETNSLEYIAGLTS